MTRSGSGSPVRSAVASRRSPAGSASAGRVVIDADRRGARRRSSPGEPTLERGHASGSAPASSAPTGSLDRAALGRIVFADPAALRDLEAIVHPAVRPRILDAIAVPRRPRARRVVVIEAIKLVEGGLAELCDEVWLVTCDPAVQLERLLGRGSTDGDAGQRIAAQAGFEARVRPVASRVLDTSGDVRRPAGSSRRPSNTRSRTRPAEPGRRDR